jgi:putative ABC transport system substrate-binding protein
MKKLFIAVFGLFAMVGVFNLSKKQSNEITIGIIEPLEHKSIDTIVEGFKQKFKELQNKKINIRVENAQNDASLQRSILQKMIDNHYNLIVPIGTTPTQMAVSMIQNTPIVSLAANFSDSDRMKLTKCNIAVVHDEISPETTLNFIHKAFPNVKKIALVHSSSEKVLPEVETAIQSAKKLNIVISEFMISSLPEMISVTQSLPSDTDAIFILKDSLVVSGISTLIQESLKRKIPLMTSDQGSVESGAPIAIGVHEKEIGEEGAVLANQIIMGKNPCDLKIKDMLKLTIFINKRNFSNLNLNEKNISMVAKQFGYQFEIN